MLFWSPKNSAWCYVSNQAYEKSRGKPGDKQYNLALAFKDFLWLSCGKELLVDPEDISLNAHTVESFLPPRQRDDKYKGFNSFWR